MNTKDGELAGLQEIALPILPEFDELQDLPDLPDQSLYSMSFDPTISIDSADSTYDYDVTINDQIGILGYTLIRTCYACPEQYDVYDETDTEFKNIKAYMRLRHGTFRVTCPDVGGDVVYTSNPHGDGIFMDFERDRELMNAIKAVKAYYAVSPDYSHRTKILQHDNASITHVAIMLNGMIYSLPKPNRHKNIEWALADLGVVAPIKGVEGFLDSTGKFLTRAEAFEVAIAAKQMERPTQGLDMLYSEDLW
jgi:hypothetical protein